MEKKISLSGPMPNGDEIILILSLIGKNCIDSNLNVEYDVTIWEKKT